MRTLLPLLALCLSLLPASGAAEVVDRVVAVVGEEIVTLSDVRGYSAERSFEAKIVGRETRDPLEALIREKLLRQEMERLGITASPDEIQAAVQEVLQRNKMTSETLRSELSRKGISLDRYKKDLGEQIRRMKFMGQVIYPRIRIPEEEILKKAGGNADEQARFRARMEILDTRAPEEIGRYLDELRAKSFVEIKK